MKYGLSEKQLKEIIIKISGFPEIEEAILFGSRAIDTFKEASDVDIALKGAKVNAGLAAKLKFVFEEDTYLPFFFDFVAYPIITNEKLKEHINKKGIVIYRKKMSEHNSQNYRIDTIIKNENAVRENPIQDIRKSEKSCADNVEDETGMSEWKECKLADVAEKFAMGPFGSNIKAENFCDSGVPVIRGTNLNFYKYVGDKILTAAEVIEELIKLSKEIKEMDKEPKEMGLSDSEYAFYTAIADNDSARQLMQKDKLRELAVVLFEKVRENASIDWTIKESVKAKLKVIVKRILRQYGYPPDMQMLATETVLKQAELLAEEMTKGK